MKFTKEDYEAAISGLQLAICQLEPDGKSCVICGDNDHQAFECGLNPLVRIAELEREVKNKAVTYVRPGDLPTIVAALLNLDGELTPLERAYVGLLKAKKETYSPDEAEVLLDIWDKYIEANRV